MRQVNQTVAISGIQLDAYPRWDGKIVLRVGAWNNTGGGMQEAKGGFVISNPARVHTFAKWTPEPVPATQSDGDLNVTLMKLVNGVPGFGSGARTSKDAMNKAVLAVFHCEQKGVTVTNWQVMRVETSDATGNHVQNNSWSTSRDENGDATMTYQYGLWPAESPWKLRVEMSRTSGFNDGEAPDLVAWAHGRGFDLTFIEVMPLGEVERDRFDQFLPLTELRAGLERRLTLCPSPHASGGPARYFDVAETGGRLGFITPLTHNFCESCNRVRLTCTGTLYMCLGQEDAADLREPLRATSDNELLDAAIDDAIARKPKGHDFMIDRRHAAPALARPMSMTGG